MDLYSVSPSLFGALITQETATKESHGGQTQKEKEREREESRERKRRER